MKRKKIDSQVTVSDQILPEDVSILLEEGVQIIVCNRPDNEASDQPAFQKIQKKAQEKNIEAIYLPFSPGKMTKDHISTFNDILSKNKKVHAYCRTGNRSSKLWEESKKESQSAKDNLGKNSGQQAYDVVIVGAGSGGISAASSILKRNSNLSIALIDPADEHFYQPGWTMVGGGIFDAPSTCKKMKELIPSGTTWIQRSVVEFMPNNNLVLLDNGNQVHYKQLIVAPGLTLNWVGIEGLEESLGKNGVTSNYRYDLAPYTWELVQNLKKGKAIFTQPPMPIKCAGAPQKALYLSADHWLKSNRLNDINIDFYNAGPVLFGVADYVPALMSYIEKYKANLKFSHNLIKIDGESKQAWFKTSDAEGNEEIVKTDFDMIHVCPPQCAPKFIQESPLADANGWLDVNPHTLRHNGYSNIWGIGDVLNTANAKTMAAARKQAPVVAENVCNTFSHQQPSAAYNGYGSCPLTVERGKIVLAEFAYGGKLVPTFPKWINDGTQATTFAWKLKVSVLPSLYWKGMLKGHEWLAKSEAVTS